MILFLSEDDWLSDHFLPIPGLDWKSLVSTVRCHFEFQPLHFVIRRKVQACITYFYLRISVRLFLNLFQMRDWKYVTIINNLYLVVETGLQSIITRLCAEWLRVFYIKWKVARWLNKLVSSAQIFEFILLRLKLVKIQTKVGSKKK